ncbi:2-C-methyl-D-erythritol 4-phosphate cytidylyltransferase [Pseudonocardia aurantiaca]|uniref:2-C-methyl-D-erythritol 4-phosphate cytidylyltransferase n=1 Tax=Pseudonocardia aurantiaca TaxID=75290 RepID=A0ABW4FYK6_9PSEU
MDVTAVVVVRGRAEPVDALTEVGGVPMVALAVRALLATGLVTHVRLHDLGARAGALVRACSGLSVSVDEGPLLTGVHSGQRAHTTSRDRLVTLREEPAGVTLLHDAARPLAPPALAAAVVEAARAGRGVSVPVLPLSDTVKRVDADGVVLATPDRAGLRVLQTPVAFHADLLGAELAADPLEHVRRCLAGGGSVHTVPGDPTAFAVHSTWDLELARLLAERTMAR